MFNSRPLLFFVLLVSLILTACSPPVPAKLSTTSLPRVALEPTLLPNATLLPKSAGTGIPAFKFPYNKSELVVISPDTGQEIGSLKPISFRDSYTYAFAPDGHTLALVTSNGLYLIDLPSWETRSYDLNLHGWMSSIAYRSDGSLLAISSGEPESQIWIIDPNNGKMTAEQKASFSIRKLQFTQDGKALMAYGPHIASTGVAATAGVSVGSPIAALYSLPGLDLLWSTELEGIRDGTFPKKESTTITDDIYLPGAAWHYEPGTAFSPNSDTLYLMHADEDKLTTVDFANRKIHTVTVQTKTSWLDRLLALTADVAYAKGMDGTTKQAFMTPDGKFLIVGGNTEKVTLPSDTSDLNISDTSIGLQVISTEDGTLVARIDTGSTPTGISSDGRYLFTASWEDNDKGKAPKTDIYNIPTMSLLKSIENVYLSPTRRLDGNLILVSAEYIGTNGDNICDMASVDPVTWTVTNRWTGDCVTWLTIP